MSESYCVIILIIKKNNNIAFNTFLLTVILAFEIFLLERNLTGSLTRINFRLSAYQMGAITIQLLIYHSVY